MSDIFQTCPKCKGLGIVRFGKLPINKLIDQLQVLMEYSVEDSDDDYQDAFNDVKDTLIKMGMLE